MATEGHERQASLFFHHICLFFQSWGRCTRKYPVFLFPLPAHSKGGANELQCGKYVYAQQVKTSLESHNNRKRIIKGNSVFRVCYENYEREVQDQSLERAGREREGRGQIEIKVGENGNENGNSMCHT